LVPDGGEERLVKAAPPPQPSVDVATPARPMCTASCPPSAVRSTSSGTWSLEWLNDQNHGDAGLIFSTTTSSGIWSLEWSNDQNHGDAGLIFYHSLDPSRIS